MAGARLELGRSTKQKRYATIVLGLPHRGTDAIVLNLVCEPGVPVLSM